jgi:hypothetical protein
LVVVVVVAVAVVVMEMVEHIGEYVALAVVAVAVDLLLLVQ